MVHGPDLRNANEAETLAIKRVVFAVIASAAKQSRALPRAEGSAANGSECLLWGQKATSAGDRTKSAMPLIVLKKSFLGDERNFLGPLMRFVRGDVRDHIVSHKSDHGPSYQRCGALQL